MSPMTDLFFRDISSFMRQEGEVILTFAGEVMRFDLKYPHERAYAVKRLLNIRHPQSDLDSLLYKNFVQEGDVVLDGGANIGFTAVELLNAGAKKVVAVEPLPELFERLRCLNKDRVIAVNKALSSSVGIAELFVSTAHNQGSSLKAEILDIFPGVFGEHLQRISVPVVTIDQLTEEFGYCNVWKLDIEGAEVDAIKGAILTLKKCPPRVIIAELIGAWRDTFCGIARETHPYVYRAVIKKEGYCLNLEASTVEIDDSVYQTSPLYVFLMSPL